MENVITEVVSNCSSADDDMPDDLFSREQRLHGAILLHIFGGIYGFILLAIICNDFFLPSVEAIVRALKISPDIGAATFMSIATTTPEFFVNLISLFLSHSDVGLGTIVGSSAFNLLGVGAFGSLAAIYPIQIERWPLSRDCAIYAFCVSVLVVIVWDYKVYWYEGLVFVILYVAYFVFMFLNNHILKWIKSVAGTLSNKPVVEQQSKSTKMQIAQTEMTSIDISCKQIKTENKSSFRAVEFNFMDYGIFRYYDDEYEKPSVDTIRKISHISRTSLLIDEEEISLWTAPKNGGKWLIFWWLFTWPIRLVLKFTLPDCRKYPRVFPLTFIMCILWIGVNSYFVTWMITIIGGTFKIPDVVMGLAFLAAGGGLPESISIIIVARKGRGEMGVSNALGANTMDILMGLGILWCIKSIQETFDGPGYYAVDSTGMRYVILCLLIGVVVLFVTFAMNGYKMCKRVGFILLVSYILFISFAILSASNVIPLGFPKCVSV